MIMRFFIRFRRLLKSREIFSNWAVLGLKYILHIGGIRRINKFTARCREGGLIKLSPEAYAMIVYLYATKSLDKIDCGSEILSVCGLNLTINQLVTEFHWLSILEVCEALREGISRGKVRREDEAWVIGGTRFKEMRFAIAEVFLMNHWPLGELDLRGREVLDIGAHVGDTALYFLAHGAKKVVAVEPHPAAYKEMIENIELNRARDKIIPINAAVGGSKGYTKIPIDISVLDAITMDALRYRREAASESYAEIPIVTLEDLIGYLENPYMIKLDCEGCEWEILRRSLESLKKFQVILMECHGGDYIDIVRRLGETHRCSRMQYNALIILLCVKDLRP